MKLRNVTDEEVDSAVDGVLHERKTGLSNEMLLDSSIKVHRRVNIKNSMVSSTYIRTDTGFELLGAVSSSRERLVDVHNDTYHTTFKLLFNGHVLAIRRYRSDTEGNLGDLVESFNAPIGEGEDE